ncbi:hypothetical protein T492DRAFT_1063933 [Pavlovales sp. CCMP2436]|nr:hypothetical protein T492DRAFT_1063933 [Pavlovales sp. CCMP2436]
MGFTFLFFFDLAVYTIRCLFPFFIMIINVFTNGACMRHTRVVARVPSSSTFVYLYFYFCVSL